MNTIKKYISAATVQLEPGVVELQLELRRTTSPEKSKVGSLLRGILRDS